MPSNFESLSVAQIKERLEKLWRKHEKLCRESMGELLYWLRKKLKAPGKRNDLRHRKEGFGAWCETNLGISRRTADRWADEWAFAHGKKKKPQKATSRHADQRLDGAETGPPKITFNLPLLLTEGQHEQFMWAVEAIGEDEVTGLVFKIVTEKAKELESPRPADPFQLPPKRPAASSTNDTLLQDLGAKQQSSGHV